MKQWITPEMLRKTNQRLIDEGRQSRLSVDNRDILEELYQLKEAVSEVRRLFEEASSRMEVGNGNN